MKIEVKEAKPAKKGFKNSAYGVAIGLTIFAILGLSFVSVIAFNKKLTLDKSKAANTKPLKINYTPATTAQPTTTQTTPTGNQSSGQSSTSNNQSATPTPAPATTPTSTYKPKTCDEAAKAQAIATRDAALSAAQAHYDARIISLNNQFPPETRVDPMIDYRYNSGVADQNSLLNSTNLKVNSDYNSAILKAYCN